MYKLAASAILQSLPYQITWVLKHRIQVSDTLPLRGVLQDTATELHLMIHIYIYILYSYDQIGIYDSFIYDNYDHLW